ncbi:MAG TPA: DUF1499 domain-containing protein [Myxococcota bacterium]|nr:DUF1499 domain-containing protein [Myxococcota bacterium]
MKRSRLALVAGIFGAVGLFDPALGAALAHFRVLEPMGGFLLFALGLVTALVGGLLGLGALYTTRAGSNRTGRSLAWVGVVSAVVAIGIVAIARQPGAGTPPINDISTDLSDPPAFPSDPSGRGRDMSYPDGFAEQIKATPAYQDLQPIRVARPPAEVFADAIDTVKRLDWEGVSADPTTGTIVASETTKLFRFVDDVAIRVRDDGTGGSVVDVRSKSRDGQGDIGANAARIRRFFAALPK